MPSYRFEIISKKLASFVKIYIVNDFFSIVHPFHLLNVRKYFKSRIKFHVVSSYTNPTNLFYFKNSIETIDLFRNL